MAINDAHHDSSSTNVASVPQRGAGVGSPGGRSTTLHRQSTSVKSSPKILEEMKAASSMKESFLFLRICTGLRLFWVHSNWNSLGQIYEPRCSIPRTHLQPADRVKSSKGSNLKGKMVDVGVSVSDYPWCFIHNEASVPAVHVCQLFVAISSKVDEPARMAF